MSWLLSVWGPSGGVCPRIWAIINVEDGSVLRTLLIQPLNGKAQTKGVEEHEDAWIYRRGRALSDQ